MASDEMIVKLSDRLCDTVDQFLLELDPDGDGIDPEEKFETIDQAFHAACDIFVERHLAHILWVARQNHPGLQKLLPTFCAEYRRKNGGKTAE